MIEEHLIERKDGLLFTIQVKAQALDWSIPIACLQCAQRRIVQARELELDNRLAPFASCVDGIQRFKRSGFDFYGPERDRIGRAKPAGCFLDWPRVKTGAALNGIARGQDAFLRRKLRYRHSRNRRERVRV